MDSHSASRVVANGKVVPRLRELMERLASENG